MRQADSHTSIPTLPSAPSLVAKEHDRRALFAALTFVDKPPRSAAALSGWFEKHLVAPGRMRRPTYVTEGFSMQVALGPAAPEDSDEPELQALVEAARFRGLSSLRALMPPAADDRFLAAAIDDGRVRRAGDGALWEPCPREEDLLSDIVLSLFAADILSYREFHDAYLCVCKTCLRIDFDPSRSGRTGCPEHQPTATVNVMRRSRPPL
ncbi:MULTISPECIES: hypothetical protein [Sorangium]|uniref:Uncharacterized protein n=1 Tax=Sorangium cellulosum TaxID=56 RepID=A0A4P2QZU5_SORCE|nr:MULTISPECIES: hypothetical protein [Sorangium]AUX35123.1 hypothetical protein SOCE836_073110 [Sorangium cellulosum]WCQ94428.1 hypothetical protein NQZ70_07194 [Sorangium sp. Soce836]